MKLIKSLIICCCLILLFGCPDKDLKDDSVITLINNSSENVVFYEEYKQIVDTSLAISSYYPTNPQIVAASIMSGNSIQNNGPYIELFSGLNDKVLMIYLFSRDTLEQVPWRRIRDEYLVLRRYDLTLEDLEAMNWLIEYP